MSKTKAVRQTRNGQITIPKAFRDELGLEPDDLLAMTLTDEGKLEIQPARTVPKASGSPWFKELYDLFAPVRQDLERYSEQEINDAIDAAVAAVRRRRRQARAG
jgi:AbrB family looped-hinge helix DNA binding protein